MATAPNPDRLLSKAASLRAEFGATLGDRVMESFHAHAHQIARGVVAEGAERTRFRFDRSLDRLLTSRWLGFPTMALMLWGVFWLTIAGANVPSSMLATLTMDWGWTWLHRVIDPLPIPMWINGLMLDGVYLAMAWVLSVMLPPMAIFFPLFSLLEDFGYLPRVAFNLDRLFKRAGAHGKQALTMMMGYGCNAAGIVSTRIIDSPRERLIAIITNNFAICNGRWPTLILIGTIFIAATAPAGLASLVASGSVVITCVLGVVVTLLVSAFLSRTWLKGEASTFSLELPPYRPPRVLKTIYTSLIDRTLIVLWRALFMAAPAGAVIWLSSNIDIGGQSIASHIVEGLGAMGWLMGLNGVILLAYIVAIPANEIIIPTILMLTLTLTPELATTGGAQPGVMLEFDDTSRTLGVLSAGGWTMLTAVNLMLFCLLHNPCSTTILTIWRETKSVKWTTIAALFPLALGILVCIATATAARLLGLV
jgi:ferrous iron transport protein B